MRLRQTQTQLVYELQDKEAKHGVDGCERGHNRDGDAVRRHGRVQAECLGANRMDMETVWQSCMSKRIKKFTDNSKPLQA